MPSQSRRDNQNNGGHWKIVIFLRATAPRLDILAAVVRLPFMVGTFQYLVARKISPLLLA